MKLMQQKDMGNEKCEHELYNNWFQMILVSW